MGKMSGDGLARPMVAGQAPLQGHIAARRFDRGSPPDDPGRPLVPPTTMAVLSPAGTSDPAKTGSAPHTGVLALGVELAWWALFRPHPPAPDHPIRDFGEHLASLD
jgi:hypothetical protein